MSLREYFLVGLSSLILLSAETPKPEPPGRLNLLLIVVDTLRHDHVGCYGAERPTTPAIVYKRHPAVGFAPRSAGRLKGDETMTELIKLSANMADDELRMIEALYDEEIRHTDSGIGKLLKRVDDLGLRGRTLVVLTADHGEEFLDHGALGHTGSVYEELVRVPLVFRLPGGKAKTVVEQPVSLAALTPTFVDLLDVDSSPGAFQAASLRELLEGAPSSPASIFCELEFVPVRSKGTRGVFKTALIEERFKPVRDEKTNRLELYDLQDDPGELRDLAGSLKEETRRMSAILERLTATVADGAVAPQPRRVKRSEIERLKALGYLGE